MYTFALNGLKMLILNISCQVVNFVPVSVLFFLLKQYILVLEHFSVLFRDYTVYVYI